MNWGTIISDALAFIISVVFVYVWNTYIKPYLEDKHLSEVANVVVHAAEAMFKSGNGEAKLAYAIDLVEEKYHIAMDDEKILAAVQAAWQAMDIEQKK